MGSSDSKYPITESFYSLQGEGFHQGKAAYFIRLAGCDIGCTWCDTKYSWKIKEDDYVPLQTLVAKVKQQKSKLIIITGGEPLMHDLSEFTKTFKQNGFILNIETSGVCQLSGQWDWICLSPKQHKPPHESILQIANELKIVISNQADLEWANSFINKVDKNCLLYLQPEWDLAQNMLPLILGYIKENPRWRLSLQIHKYLEIE